MNVESALDSYNRRFVPVIFDALIATIFAPFGGVRRLRSQALEFAGVRSGDRVLELGCGTGSMTRMLIDRGARVIAIDGSHRMLDRARSRAPGAVFVQQELEALNIDGRFDLVLLAFVLHELPAEVRRDVLRKAAGVLAPGGVVAVVDHAVPEHGLLASAWRAMLMRLEPPSVAECIGAGYAGDFRTAGLQVERHRHLAGGTAAATVCVPATS